MPTRMPAAERDALHAKVVQLRREKTTWDQIAKQIGRTKARAHQIYQEALAAHPLTCTQVDEHRLEQTELMELVIRQLLTISAGPTTSDRNKVEALKAIVAASERTSNLLGLDAPKTVITMTSIEAEIRMIETEFRAQGFVISEEVTDALTDEIRALETQLAGDPPA